MNNAQNFYLVEAAISRAYHPGECQQILLRNHGYAIDFWTTSFTDSIWRRQEYRLSPYAATININVSLKSTRAFKANHADLYLMQTLRLPKPAPICFLCG